MCSGKNIPDRVVNTKCFQSPLTLKNPLIFPGPAGIRSFYQPLDDPGICMRGGWLGPMGASAGVIISIVAYILTIIVPLVNGRYSRDKTGVILIGVVQFFLTYGISRIVSGNSSAGTGYRVYSVLYVVSLSKVGGLEGFFVAKKTAGSVLIALLLTGIRVGIFFSEIL